MDFILPILIAIITPLLLLLISSCIFLLKIFFRGSLSDPLYPPLMGTVYEQFFHFKRLYDHLVNFNRKHPTFRLLTVSYNNFYTVDTRNIEHMLKTNFHNYSKGQSNYNILKDLFGDGIFAVDGENWRKQRKLASFEFSTRVLRDFSSVIFRKNAVKLALILKEHAKEKQTFDIQNLLMKSALDSIFEVGFGVELNCLGASSEVSDAFIKAVDEASELVYLRYVDLLWRIKKTLNVGSEARLRKSIQVIDDFVYAVIRTKRAMLSDQVKAMVKEDILSRFLVESQKDPKIMNEKYLRDIILNFIIAGKDSTANTLSWFFYMVCKHPSIQEKIFQQVKGVTDQDEVSAADFAKELTSEVLDKMHYLHAALTETLRLYPATAIDGRCAEADDILPDGYRLKKGDGLYYMAYTMGRMKTIWGEDAEEFKPERWLEDGVFKPESPFKFVAFHGGPRICLGKEFAYRQMKIVSMVLLRFFRFQLNDVREEVRYRTMFTLQIDGGLNLHAFSRNC